MMDILYNRSFLNHNPASDVEGPYRLGEFAGKLKETYANGEEYLSLTHDESYIKSIKKACSAYECIAEVWLTPASYLAACQSVGVTLKAAIQGDFALVRPPGHHANRNKALGFCFFNNIAIAAQYLVNQGKKVCIIDIDSHHGNGTQELFYSSNLVFYASIHELYSYPFTGFPTETGEGEGAGCTMNIPLIAGSNDDKFLDALDKILDKARLFEPDVVGVSAGFDGYFKDKLLNQKYTLKAYYECGFRIRRTFSNVFAVLEGGYHEDMKPCVETFIDGINVGARPRPNRFNHEMSVG